MIPVKYIAFTTGLFICALLRAGDSTVVRSHFYNSTIECVNRVKDVCTLKIYHGDTLVFTSKTDSALNNCTGYCLPDTQPSKDYFIIVKHAPHAGRIYIIDKKGGVNSIPGGSFWYAPKHGLLFILAERDLTNLVIYSIPKNKTLLEKFNCDEFESWYYRKGSYYGVVDEECGQQPHQEKEFSEWMHPFMSEKFSLKDYTLEEEMQNRDNLDKSVRLKNYCACGGAKQGQ